MLGIVGSRSLVGSFGNFDCFDLVQWDNFFQGRDLVQWGNSFQGGGQLMVSS